MDICVFSFNRGEFLRNCVASIERCLPGCSLTVFDDNSDDPVTRDVLAAIADRHTVVRPDAADAASSKHGGLYANMQAAFERQRPGSIVCFLQDDMQVVRPVSAAEIASLRGHLVAAPDAGLLQPTFLKGCNRATDGPLTRTAPDSPGYHVDRLASSAGAWYSDVLIASVDKLRAVNWTFLPRESSNERQAREMLNQIVYLKNPFAAWLPLAPAYRGKTRTFALRHAERSSRSGFYPLREMSAEETKAFVDRDAAVLPYAEDFLSVTNGTVPEPWIYHPLQGRRLLKTLNSIELKLRRLFPVRQ